MLDLGPCPLEGGHVSREPLRQEHAHALFEATRLTNRQWTLSALKSMKEVKWLPVRSRTAMTLNSWANSISSSTTFSRSSEAYHLTTYAVRFRPYAFMEVEVMNIQEAVAAARRGAPHHTKAPSTNVRGVGFEPTNP